MSSPYLCWAMPYPLVFANIFKYSLHELKIYQLGLYIFEVEFSKKILLIKFAARKITLFSDGSQRKSDIFVHMIHWHLNILQTLPGALFHLKNYREASFASASNWETFKCQKFIFLSYSPYI